ncbi:MAG: Na/Pi cotransporter family protein [Oscillospiraceae bacterium]|nr:Na/Pi cotransporter family protein [Oscillospiraceae bacterium]
MGIAEVLSLLGGVALFLFGMSLMGDSLKMVAGSKLEVVLYRLSGTQLKGILLGTGVTAVIQSSSATSVMVVGFVNSEMMKVRQAIGIIMGAIIGTSITGWIICLSDIGGNTSGWMELLSTETLTSVVALIGIILYMFSGDMSRRHVGGILMGFAVLMFGMKAMSGAVSGLKDDESFVRILTDFSNPVLGIIVGMAFTSILQSASAAVGILQALAITGAVSFEVAFPIIMGIAIGAAVPVLLSAMGASADGKRTALSYLIIDLFGVIIVSVIFYAVNAFVHFGFMSRTMTAVSIALVNTLFRVVIVMILAPMTGLIEKFVSLFVKDDKERLKGLRDMDLLEERFLTHPALSIEQSRQVINSMARCVVKNVTDALSLVDKYTKDGFAEVQKEEELVDRYEDKLGTYLVQITRLELTKQQNIMVGKYLHSITDFERMSDHALNIAECAQEMHDKKLNFSKSATHELSVLRSAVSEIVALAVKAFVEDDLSVAYRIEPLEEKIDSLCDEMKLHHINRISDGTCTLQLGFVFNDLLTNLERMADHCSNIGVAMIELASGALETHDYYNKLMEETTDQFKESFAKYDAKFKL